MRKTVTFLGLLGVTLGITLGVTQPAFADENYVNDAVNGLGNSSVYIDSDVSLSHSDKISSELNNSHVDVVVLPPLAVDTYSASDVATMIRSKTGESTIVVVVDNTNSGDRIGVSSAKNQDEIATVLNEALGKSNGDAGEAISSTVQDVKSLSAGGSDAATDGRFNLAFVFVPLGILFALAVTAVVSVVIYRPKKDKDSIEYRVVTNRKGQSAETEAPNKFSELLPESLVPSMKQLSDLIRKHNKLPKDSLSPDLKIIIDNVQELFTRLKNKGTESQQRIAEVEYADKLPKLIEALGSNYYMDIVEHDDLWDNPQERLDSVTGAVKAVEKQLIANIRQVNASKDLEFQVALGSLMGPADGTTMKDIYKTNSLEKREN